MKLKRGIYKMNRLCIYLTYNKENRIFSYMAHTLKALHECSSTLYVVCNYPKIKKGEELLHPYTDNIIYRENLGYDAGAYKDMLCDILGWDEVYKYDELILVNDSFFGPFFDLKKFFAEMQEKDCDYWGMTRSPGIILGTTQYGSHIQSYFLVFRSRVLHSKQFKQFWEKINYPANFTEAIRNFEIGINEYLEKNSFCSFAFTDMWGLKLQANDNPCYLYSLEMIYDKGMPFLKKKNLLMRNPGFYNTLQAINYLKEQNLYPVSWIYEVLDGQFHSDGDTLEGSSLARFVAKYRRIYIYGAGVAGKNLLIYFEHKGWKAEGLIVTDKSNQDVACVTLDEAELDAKTGIIISVICPEVASEIVSTIGTRCKQEQLFLISDCGAIRIPV